MASGKVLGDHVSDLNRALQRTLQAMRTEDGEDRFRNWTIAQQKQIEADLIDASTFVDNADAMFTGKEDLGQLTERELRDKSESVRELSRKCSILHSTMEREPKHQPAAMSEKAKVSDAICCGAEHGVPGMTDLMEKFGVMMLGYVRPMCETSPLVDLKKLEFRSICTNQGAAVDRLNEMSQMANYLKDILTSVATTRAKRLEGQAELEACANQAKDKLIALAPRIIKHGLREHVQHSSANSKRFMWFDMGLLETIHAECETTRDRITEELVFRRLKAGIGLPCHGTSEPPNSPMSTASFVDLPLPDPLCPAPADEPRMPQPRRPQSELEAMIEQQKREMRKNKY